MDQWNYQCNNARYENTSNFIASPNQFFSQYNQDRSLERCIFKGYQNGICMDIGAHDGVDLNNTLYFEKTNNWKCVHVEPLKRVYDRLVTNRPNGIHINCAVSDVDGTQEFLSVNGYSEMLSGLKSEYDARHVNRIQGELSTMGGSSDVVLVDTKRIETICDIHNITHIHYLSIDIEGGEMKALQSINFSKVFIDVIGFENNYPDTQSIPITFLKENGYLLLPHHVADIFMIHKDSEFLKNNDELRAIISAC